MFVRLRPAASFPSSTGSASRKLLVDNPRRYSSGSTSATWGDRRMYGGKIRLVNRCRSPSSWRPIAATVTPWSCMPAASAAIRWYTGTSTTARNSASNGSSATVQSLCVRVDGDPKTVRWISTSEQMVTAPDGQLRPQGERPGVEVDISGYRSPAIDSEPAPTPAPSWAGGVQRWRRVCPSG